MSLTIDQLPDLTEPYELTDEQIAEFQEHGHILLRGVCTPAEIAVYRDVLVDAAKRFCTETRPMEERDTYGKAFLQIMNLWENDELVRSYVLSKRFAGIAARLLGSESIRLYHDQALFKEPHGGHTPWHQDQYYWPLDTDKTITMWMPLVDASPDMGTMMFASGSHQNGYLGTLEISDESEEYFKNFVVEKGYTLSQSGAMQAGDATFHAGWTLHCAPGNATEATREVMTLIYFDGEARTLEPDNKNRWNDLERWLPGVVGGEPAASPLNPVVFP